jgi:hypothetical protein
MSTKPRMFPDPLPDYIRRDPLRSAECEVYDQLASQLDGEYTVFYSRPWLGLAPDGREIDGEVDFVVCHPNSGFLTIEVKGGGISRNAQTERWTSRDRYGIVHDIKSPVAQAKAGKHQILEKLKQSSEWSVRFIRTRHGVILPHSVGSKSDLGADMPRRIFAFNEDMSRLSEWVRQRLADPAEDKKIEEPLGSDGVRALEFILAKSFTLRVPLQTVIAADDRKIIVLTDEQYHILEAFTDWRRLAIAGGAGTGKTILAAEKARRLAREANKVLLLCYNRPLAEFLKTFFVDTPRPDVHTFHEFCGVMAAAAGVPVPNSGNQKLLFERLLPEALVSALERRDDLRYDAIIVDEGQDFMSAWWPIIELCMRSETEGLLYVFYDPNQKVYGAASAFPLRMPQAPIVLARNVRNAKPIFDFAKGLYAGPRYTSAGPDGAPVEFIELDQGYGVREQLGEIVGRLCVSERVHPHDIAILSGLEKSASKLATLKKIGRFAVTTADEPRRDAIVVDTIRRFKGLERAIVVLVELSGVLETAELLYVGCTRARLKLIALGTPSELERLQRVARPAVERADG